MSAIFSAAALPSATAHRRARMAGLGVVAALLLCVTPTPAAAATVVPGTVTFPAPADAVVVSGWQWPLRNSTVVRPYEAPAHEYGPGHRGVDLASAGTDTVQSDTVQAPAAGVIAFSGPVAGRGILTIDHGDGLVTTLEPVDERVAVGSVVAAGDPVARLSVGGHAGAGTLHFGVRRNGVYINPLSLLGGVPRAILLPCCS